MKYGEDCDGAWGFRGLLGVKKSNMKEEGSRLGEECGVTMSLSGSCKGRFKIRIESQDRYGVEN